MDKICHIKNIRYMAEHTPNAKATKRFSHEPYKDFKLQKDGEQSIKKMTLLEYLSERYKIKERMLIDGID